MCNEVQSGVFKLCLKYVLLTVGDLKPLCFLSGGVSRNRTSRSRVYGAFRLPSEVCSGNYITFDSVPVTSQKSKMDVSVISIVSLVSLYQHITAHCLIVWA